MNEPRFANEWYTIRYVADMFDISESYIRKLETLGVLQPIRTQGGHRRYSPQDIERIRAHLGRGTRTRMGECLVYVRSALGGEYSSYASEDIDRQMDAIASYARAHGLTLVEDKVFVDRGGLELEFTGRHGLASLLRTVPNYPVNTILVTSKARLGLIVGGILESVCQLFAVQILEVDPDEPLIAVEVIQEFKQFLGYFFQAGLKVDLHEDAAGIETFRRVQNVVSDFVAHRMERAQV